MLPPRVKNDLKPKCQRGPSQLLVEASGYDPIVTELSFSTAQITACLPICTRCTILATVKFKTRIERRLKWPSSPQAGLRSTLVRTAEHRLFRVLDRYRDERVE